MNAAKRIIRCVKGTSSFGLKFSRNVKQELQGYSNRDWVGNVDDSKSISGYCFSFGSALFAWNSKKQEIVTQSFAKAKYMAAAATMNQAL